MFPDLELSGEYPARFFAIRHIALAIPLFHGLLHQDRTVLGALYHVFLVIAVLDVGSILYFGWSYPFLGPQPLLINAVIGSVMFIIPMATVVAYLSRK